MGKKAKKEHKSRIYRQFLRLNPKNLQKEVHVYGYNYSWQMHLTLNVCSLLGILAIGILFRLKPGCLAVVMLAVTAALPVLVRDMYKRAYEQKRFADVTTYMEQMLYAYPKSGKVISALRETREIFEEGQMRDKIDEALAYLEAGWAHTEKGVLREALERIEEPYRCVKLASVHELLVNGEEYGGGMENSILLLLNDIEGFKRGGYRLQAEKKKSHTDNIISILTATALCAAALYVLEAMGGMFPGDAGVDIFKVTVIQASSVLFLLFMLYVLVKSTRNLTDNWLQKQSLQNEEILLKSYDIVKNYDGLREIKKGLILAAPFLAAGAAAVCLGHRIIGMCGILAAALMLLGHRIGYNVARREIHNEMYIALPQWLMQIALLLQSNNVQVSIAKSAESAPPVLKDELESLMERLKRNPGSLKSYTDFCKDFDIPEAGSCMKMLHAISEYGTGDAGAQINSLIRRVNEMQEMADQLRDKELAFRMKMFFSYPVLGATVKLLIDLTVGMLFMLQMLGNISV